MTDQEIGALLYLLNVSLNVASAICGLAVMAIILICMWISKDSMNRVSIRFTLGISVVDVLRAVTVLLYNQFTEDGVWCVGISFTYHYLTLVYFFLNVAVALNLQLVFVHGLVFRRRRERVYWIVSLMFPIVLLAFPLGAHRLGQDRVSGYCEFRNPGTFETIGYVYFSFLIWCLMSCLYCAIAVGAVVYKLNRQANVLDYIVKSKTSHSEADVTTIVLRQKVRKLIIRITFYCIIPIVTQSWYLALRVIASYTDHVYVYLYFISVISSDMPGVLNLMVLLVDPSFSSAIETTLKQKGFKVPKCLDSSIKFIPNPSNKTETIDDNLAQKDDIGFFVPIKSKKLYQTSNYPKLTSETPNPGPSISPKSSADVDVNYNPTEISQFSNHAHIAVDDTVNERIPSPKRTIQASEFIKNI
ncbi:hypothetical protein L0F63_005147 [Massospora cicadina]|nr:hypothetical protein L0F63_005147 [Massospora cicadina]